jgi:hypothetical protein
MVFILSQDCNLEMAINTKRILNKLEVDNNYYLQYMLHYNHIKSLYS